MSLLIVEAEATMGTFYVPEGGHSEDDSDLAGPAIAVSVTKSDGTPLGGLGTSNFAVRFLPAYQWNPVFLKANVAIVAKQQVPGLYLLGLKPAKATIPPKACLKYLYAVAVTSSKGADHGQTLTSLELCE
jgi:hypothetical protein